MSDYVENNGEIGWEDEISIKSGYYLLPEGDYNFTVTAFERGRFEGSTKTPPCNKTILTLEVKTQDGTAHVKCDLIMHTNFVWKLSDFFCSIGQASRSDEKLRPRWNELVGSQGRAHFKVRTYQNKNGNTVDVNDVDKFYDYDPDSIPQSTQQTIWKPEGSRSATPWDSKF